MALIEQDIDVIAKYVLDPTHNIRFKGCRPFDLAAQYPLGINEVNIANAESIPKDSASMSERIVSNHASADGTNIFPLFFKVYFDWTGISILDRNAGVGDLLLRIGNANFTRLFNGETPDNLRAQILDATTTSSLDYEFGVYSFITRQIVMKNVSPNFIPLYYFSRCRIADLRDSLRDSPTRMQDGVTNELIEKLTVISESFPNLHVKFMSTGSTRVMPKLFDVIQMINDPVDIRSILFQSFYGLYVMQKYRINQGDLHFNNIFIEVLPNPVTLDITIGGLRVSFTTRYVVKFFDWDRSYVDEFNRQGQLNDILDAYSWYNLVNRFRKNRDFYNFICGCFNSGNVEVVIQLQSMGFNAGFQWFQDPQDPSHIVRLSAQNRANLTNWCGANPAQVRVTNNPAIRYITIPKAEFEIVFEVPDRTEIETHIGRDRYNMIENLYLMINTTYDAVRVVPAAGCNPLHDYSQRLVLDIEHLFENQINFSIIIRGLNTVPTATQLVYVFREYVPDPITDRVPDTNSALFSVNERPVVPNLAALPPMTAPSPIITNLIIPGAPAPPPAGPLPPVRPPILLASTQLPRAAPPPFVPPPQAPLFGPRGAPQYYPTTIRPVGPAVPVAGPIISLSPILTYLDHITNFIWQNFTYYILQNLPSREHVYAYTKDVIIPRAIDFAKFILILGFESLKIIGQVFLYTIISILIVIIEMSKPAAAALGNLLLELYYMLYNIDYRGNFETGMINIARFIDESRQTVSPYFFQLLASINELASKMYEGMAHTFKKLKSKLDGSETRRRIEQAERERSRLEEDYRLSLRRAQDELFAERRRQQRIERQQMFERKKREEKMSGIRGRVDLHQLLYSPMDASRERQVFEERIPTVERVRIPVSSESTLAPKLKLPTRSRITERL